MRATILLVALAFTQAQPEKPVTDPEKKEFLQVLSKLPTKGEFFTQEAITKAIPYTRVLLALTEKDLEKRDIYPYLALSAGLMGQKEAREYGITNFGKIAHPTIKLGWAIGLFRDKAPSPEVVAFLRKALDSKEESRTLSEMLGPGFEEFKEKVIRADEAGKRTKIELVKEHATKGFPEYGGGLDYTCQSCVFAPGQLLYAARPLKQQGELNTYNLAKGTMSQFAIPQPKGFKAEFDFPKYFGKPVLSINSGGDLFCRWTIKGNGDHGLALLKKGSDSFEVKRVALYLADCFVLAGQEGTWYLLQGGLDNTVYQVDKELNLTLLAKFVGKGHRWTGDLDARFISKDVLHLFWGERCVDFDVKKQKWLHNREISRPENEFVGPSEPTLLQLQDESLHYLWRTNEGPDQTQPASLHYQAEADGKTVKLASTYQYRAIAVGDRIVVCYTVKDSPEKVFFRVINHGALGPVSEITVGKGRIHNLWSENMVLYSEAERIWFVNTLATNTIYELKLVDAKKP
jgi:hypothetical protein